MSLGETYLHVMQFNDTIHIHRAYSVIQEQPEESLNFQTTVFFHESIMHQRVLGATKSLQYEAHIQLNGHSSICEKGKLRKACKKKCRSAYAITVLH